MRVEESWHSAPELEYVHRHVVGVWPVHGCECAGVCGRVQAGMPYRLTVIHPLPPSMWLYLPCLAAGPHLSTSPGAVVALRHSGSQTLPRCPIPHYFASSLTAEIEMESIMMHHFARSKETKALSVQHVARLSVVSVSWGGGELLQSRGSS